MAERERCTVCGQFGSHCSHDGGDLVACDVCWELVCGACAEVDPEEGEMVCRPCNGAIKLRLEPVGAMTGKERSG